MLFAPVFELSCVCFLPKLLSFLLSSSTCVVDDFELVDANVTFITGNNEATFTIRASSDDVKEENETFMIGLQCSSPSAIAVGVVIGGSGTASVTVQDTTSGGRDQDN